MESSSWRRSHGFLSGEPSEFKSEGGAFCQLGTIMLLNSPGFPVLSSGCTRGKCVGSAPLGVHSFLERSSAIGKKGPGPCVGIGGDTLPPQHPPGPPHPTPHPPHHQPSLLLYNRRHWRGPRNWWSGWLEWPGESLWLVLPCSSWPEDTPGGARPIPRTIWDGAPRRHEWWADQPQRRLRQSPQHVAADECSCGCCRRGGLWALPDGEDGRDWGWMRVGTCGGPAPGSPHTFRQRPSVSTAPSCPPSSTCRFIKLRPNTFCFTVCGWKKAVFRSSFCGLGDIWFSPTKVGFFSLWKAMKWLK